MSGKKKAKKKSVKKDSSLINELRAQLGEVNLKLSEAIECLKNYIKRDQIADLANPAIDLLTKWGIDVGEPKP